MDYNVKCTFNLFSKEFGWTPPHIDRIIEREELYEFYAAYKLGALGNDKILIIYKESGAHAIVEICFEKMNSKIIREYSYEEFVELCEDAPAVWPNILTESENYIILQNVNEAELIRKVDNRNIVCVGRRIATPLDAYIDPNERFCIAVGQGLARYEIQEKYDGFYYEMEVPYTTEAYREGKIEWCDHIDEVTESYIEVSYRGNNKRKFDINTLQQID